MKASQGGGVGAVSLGPERAERLLREALAKGADRAIHILTEGEPPADPYQTAEALSKGLAGESFDLVLAGLQSDDLGFGQTGGLLAQLLGVTHASLVVELAVQAGGLRVKCELEAGRFQEMALALPAVVAVQSGINKPRYANIRGFMAAKKKEIRRIALAELCPDASLSETQRIIRIRNLEKPKQTVYLEGDPSAIAGRLMAELKPLTR